MSFATDAVRSTRYRSTDCESSGYKCQILPQGKKDSSLFQSLIIRLILTAPIKSLSAIVSSSSKNPQTPNKMLLSFCL